MPLEPAILKVGPFQSNCYIVRPAGPGPVVVIDPGDEAERILARLKGRDVAAILLTHAHLDHIGAVAPLAEATGAPVYLHPADRFLYDAAAEHGRMFGVRVETPPAPDVELADGDVLTFGGGSGGGSGGRPGDRPGGDAIEFTVRHTPGHSPGHVVFIGGGVAFVGDCVFAGSIGRTDLPGGDTATLLSSIRRHILSLPPDTVLYPGHMGPTTAGAEASSNPFLIAGGYA